MTSSDFDINNSHPIPKKPVSEAQQQEHTHGKVTIKKHENTIIPPQEIDTHSMTEKEILRQETRKNIIEKATEKEKSTETHSQNRLNPTDTSLELGDGTSPIFHALGDKYQDSKKHILRIGTRGSPLALAQANYVKSLLESKQHIHPFHCEIVIIQTSGDKFLNSKLQDIGGKGLFTKEIEEALLRNDIDLAVHSMKDVPTYRQVGLEISAILPREDVRDCLISEKYDSLYDLPQGAKVGTASLRRHAQLLRVRPDLNISLLRGNVQTRLAKVHSGEFDATLLALAGLNRLGVTHYAKEIFPVDFFPPAPAQGAIGIETALCLRKSFKNIIYAIDCTNTRITVTAERSFLRTLDGNCRTPIAAYATIEGDVLSLTGQILSEDGQKIAFAKGETTIDNAEKIGHSLGMKVKMDFDGFSS